MFFFFSLGVCGRQVFIGAWTFELKDCSLLLVKVVNNVTKGNAQIADLLKGLVNFILKSLVVFQTIF
jgi:uncharacterized Fe-S cluster-containing protein